MVSAVVVIGNARRVTHAFESLWATSKHSSTNSLVIVANGWWHLFNWMSAPQVLLKKVPNSSEFSLELRWWPHEVYR